MEQKKVKDGYYKTFHRGHEILVEVFGYRPGLGGWFFIGDVRYRVADFLKDGYKFTRLVEVKEERIATLERLLSTELKELDKDIYADHNSEFLEDLRVLTQIIAGMKGETNE